MHCQMNFKSSQKLNFFIHFRLDMYAFLQQKQNTIGTRQQQLLSSWKRRPTFYGYKNSKSSVSNRKLCVCGWQASKLWAESKLWLRRMRRASTTTKMSRFWRQRKERMWQHTSRHLLSKDVPTSVRLCKKKLSKYGRSFYCLIFS